MNTPYDCPFIPKWKRQGKITTVMDGNPDRDVFIPFLEPELTPEDEKLLDEIIPTGTGNRGLNTKKKQKNTESVVIAGQGNRAENGSR